MRLLLLGTVTGCSFALPLDDDRSPDSGGARITYTQPVLEEGGADDGEDGPPCAVTALALLPEDGSIDAYVRDPLRIQLSEPDPSVAFVLRTADGETVDGLQAARTDDPTSVEFRPSDALQPLSEYRVSVGFCDGRETLAWTFFTSAVGQSLTASLDGRAYQLDLEGARWMRPAGIGGLVPFVSDRDLLVGVETVVDERLQARLVPGQEGVQDMCAASSELPEATLLDSWLRLAEPRLRLSVDGLSVELLDAEVSASLVEDGSALVGGRVTATVDLRQVVPLAASSGLAGSADELCRFFATYGSLCERCSDGEKVCFALEVEGIAGAEVDGPLSCVGLAACHPSCASSTCADPTAGECSG